MSRDIILFRVYIAKLIYSEYNIVSNSLGGVIMLIFQIEHILKDKNKSLYWLAKETKISYPALHRITTNKTVSVNLDVLERLCTALDVDLDTLLKKDED